VQIISPASTVAWPIVLEEVQSALSQAEAEAAGREQALALLQQVSEPAEAPAADAKLRRRAEERRRLWESRLLEAEEVARETDAALRDTEEALRQWLLLAGPPAEGSLPPSAPPLVPALATEPARAA
jgi:hypothetical protein